MAGYRGLLAPWIGGAGSPRSEDVGYRGLLAPWVGGAANPAAAPGADCGYRGLLAFWAGGASNGTYVPPEPPGPFPGVGPPFRWRIRPSVREDEEILAVITAFLNMVNR